MAPALATYARSILTHALTTREPDNDGITSLGPREAHNRLLARDTATINRPNPESGIIHPGDINNKFIFVLFGLLGVAIVCTGIWFFFWAKNGGFYFKKDDWDDYKTTVLRRKGPNGTTLSGATTETDLGGGSVYKDIDEGTEFTGITGGVSDIVGREKRRRRREQKEREKEREKERRREEKRRAKDEKKAANSRSRDSKAGAADSGSGSPHKRKVGDDGAVIDEEAEAEAAEYLRNYRHERPARVGGLNRESDASTWDGSTNPSESSRGGYTESTVTSELIPNRERTPTSSPATANKKKTGGGIRKVYSTADKRDSRESERIRAEARKLQEKGRAATAAAASSSGGGHRRNFSWQRDNQIDEDTAMMAAPPSYTASEVETRIPGSWAESDVGSDVGTKAYYHVIPGLSSSGGGSSAAGTDVRDYAEERRKNRRSGGYRRER